MKWGKKKKAAVPQDANSKCWWNYQYLCLWILRYIHVRLLNCSISIKEVKVVRGMPPSFKLKFRFRLELWAEEWQFRGSLLYSVICAGAAFQTLMTVCCFFRVWFLWEGSVLHHSITITHTQGTKTDEHTLRLFVISSRVIWATYKTVNLIFSFFLLTCEGVAAVLWSDETLDPQPGV